MLVQATGRGPASTCACVGLADGLRLRAVDRQAHREGGALAFATLDADGAAVRLDDVPRAGQSKARALDATDHVGRALEPLEDTFSLRVRDADPVVAHGQYRFGVLAVHAHLDQPAIGTVLDGIVDQIADDAPQTAHIPTPDQVGLGRLESQLVALTRKGVLG